MRRKTFLTGMGGLILNSCGQSKSRYGRKAASSGGETADAGNGIIIKPAESNAGVSVNTDLSKYTIALNIGHCSDGDGAIHGSIVEKECNEIQTEIAHNLLIQNGIPRENIEIIEYSSCPGDPLRQIPKTAKDFTVFVSVHNNAGKGRGPETYAHRQAGPNDTALNNLLFRNIYDRVKPHGQSQYRGPKNSNFAVLVGARNYNVLAASLTEGFFVDDPTLKGDANNVKKLNELVGNGIAFGIIEYLNKLESGQTFSSDYIYNPVTPEEAAFFEKHNPSPH